MALTINSNIASLYAQNSMRKHTSALNKTFARLSSGLRINTAGDDASGLAVSTRMQAQILSMNAASRNANDGVSLVQVAESALSENVTALQRIRELAVLSNTSTISTTDQANLQLEVAELMAEIERVADTTDYNNTLLLDGNFTTKGFQIGTSGGETMQVTIGNAQTSDLGLSTGVGVKSLSIGAGAGAVTGTGAGYVGSSISKVDNALDSISTIRANLGAYQSRFEHVIGNLSSIVASTTAAHGRIVDADIANETANMAKYSILQQAGLAVLAQANQQPNVAMSLLIGMK
jgi:flagellin